MSKYDIGIVNYESKKKNSHRSTELPHLQKFSIDLEQKKSDIQSGNSLIGLPIFLKRRMISPRLAAVQKLNSI